MMTDHTPAPDPADPAPPSPLGGPPHGPDSGPDPTPGEVLDLVDALDDRLRVVPPGTLRWVEPVDVQPAGDGESGVFATVLEICA